MFCFESNFHTCLLRSLLPLLRHVHTNKDSMTMDPHHRAQDVLCCKLCEKSVPPLYCVICTINLCEACVGEHLLDESKEHIVMPIKQRGFTLNYPTCLNIYENSWTSLWALWYSRVCTLYFFSETPIPWCNRYQEYFGKKEKCS